MAKFSCLRATYLILMIIAYQLIKFFSFVFVKQVIAMAIPQSPKQKMAWRQNPVSIGKEGQRCEWEPIRSKLQGQGCLIALMLVEHAHHVD